MWNSPPDATHKKYSAGYRLTAESERAVHIRISALDLPQAKKGRSLAALKNPHNYAQRWVDNATSFRRILEHMEAQILGASSKSTPKSACRFVIRQQPEPAEVLQFVVGGLEIGQQVITLAGPTWLKDLAASLNQKGIRSEALLRSGRLVFLTAPDCLAQLSKPSEALYHGVLHRNGSVVRWVTDWSWAYGNGSQPETILKYQKRIHNHIHELTALSLCTVHCNQLERKSVLAMLVDHRRASQSRSYAA